VPVEILLNEFF